MEVGRATMLAGTVACWALLISFGLVGQMSSKNFWWAGLSAVFFWTYVVFLKGPV